MGQPGELELHLARARQLLALRRERDAERELRAALTIAPNDADAHALLALTLNRQKRTAEALQEAQTAMGAAPDVAYSHYVLALIYMAREQHEPARQAIREALRLDPQEAAYHAVLSRLYTWQKEWYKALDAAEAGLRCDPQHVECLNLRAMALVRTGRQAEAGAVLRTALAQEPENAATHANQGWTLLQSGDAAGAFTHFREALRLDPMSQWARAGIVEAMKAHHPIYRLLLRYSLWLSGLTEGEQWGVVGVLYTLRVGLHTAASMFWLLWFLVLPFDLLYQLFVVLRWTARPLFALVLRYDRFGRQVLPPEEITASNWFAACLFAAELSVLGGLLFRNLAFLVPLLLALSMLVPVSGTFQCPPGRRRLVLVLYTGLLALLALGVTGFALVGTAWSAAVAVTLGVGFVLARGLFPWLVLILLALGRDQYH